MNYKTLILAAVIVVIIGSIFYFESQKTSAPAPQEPGGTEVTPAAPLPEDSASEEIGEVETGNEETEVLSEAEIQARERVAQKARQYELAKEISTPDGFVNVEQVTLQEHIGKNVILVDFWTYSCINCQRTIPFLNAWYSKYKDEGLVIIGVHTPEFQFEHKYENVVAATERFGVQYPVVLDNDYSTWSAYRNRYWPRKYLVDIDGFIVYDHIGEGAYEETEQQIQRALEERMAVLGQEGEIAKGVAKPADAPEVDFLKVRSPEIYFGAFRNTYLGNGERQTLGTQELEEPADIDRNTLYLAGEWNFENEFAENKSGNAKVIFRYNAKDVYLVANSKSGVNVQILQDGVPVQEGAGEDVAKDGSGAAFIKEDGLYKLIEGNEYGEHVLEIIVENPGLRAFTFTFG